MFFTQDHFFLVQDTMSMFAGDLSSLSTLLEDSAKAAEKREAVQAQPPKATGVTVVKGRAEVLAANEEKKKVEELEKQKIWDASEAPIEDALLCGKDDDREVPRYEFSYKQAVGTQDTFLNMNDITPASTDCSHLIIKVHFPGCTMKELDLDVTKNRIRAESKSFKLFTYLPVNVDHDKGNAKFDKDKCVLTVTVPIIHWLAEQLAD